MTTSDESNKSITEVENGKVWHAESPKELAKLKEQAEREEGREGAREDFDELLKRAAKPKKIR